MSKPACVHSPAPFRLDYQDSAGRPFIRDAQEHPIARVMPATVWHTQNGMPMASDCRQQANAALLLASPQLLKAAMQAIAAFDTDDVVVMEAARASLVEAVETATRLPEPGTTGDVADNTSRAA
ncbi:hypothetical protein [Rhodovibrio sodomensis]|nr:hypothetical protein [Rhodovibrio sodomensis]